MNILIAHDKIKFASQVEYTFDQLFTILGLDYEFFVTRSDVALQKTQRKDYLTIIYSEESFDSFPAHRKIHIISSEFFCSRYQTSASLPESPLDWTEVSGLTLPVLYQADRELTGEPCLVSTTEEVLATYDQSSVSRSITTRLDIVASSFFMLSRYEEQRSQELSDTFGRFPLEAHLAFREGFWRIPVVNLYAELLASWIEKASDGQLKSDSPVYPGAHPFGLCLTHDVDHPRKFTPIGIVKTAAKVALQRQKPAGIRQIGSYLLTGDDPFWNFDQIINWEKTYDFQSTFFLVANKQHKLDPEYGRNEEKIAHLCKTIRNLGGEVGLHGSFTSYQNAEILINELAVLAKHAPVIGIRQHYLRLDTQHSFAAMEQAGLSYDCTLGFSGEVGFRSGIAGPHYPFSLSENRPFRVLEIPLIIMDTSLWASVGKDMPPKAIWEDMLQVLNLVKRYQGCVSILWHNGFFDEVSFPGYRQLYLWLLEWLHDNNGWGASGRQVHDWFTTHRKQATRA